MSSRVLGVIVWTPAAVEFCALRDGGGDGLCEEGEAGGGYEGADVDVVFVVLVAPGVGGAGGGGERGGETEVLDAGLEEGDEEGVGARAGDDAFDADAILAGGGEDAAHEDGDDLVLQVGSGDGVQDYGGVFSAELDADGG